MNNTAGIILADVHAVVRHGLVRLLSEDPSIEVLAEAATAAQVLASINQLPASLLITDLTMPDMPGLELVKQVKLLRPDLRVMVFSMSDDPETVRKALLADCQAYVCKSSEPAIILSAVRQCLAGKRFVDPTLTADLIVSVHNQKHMVPHARLSSREMQVMLLLVEGKTVNSIAEKLFLSAKTVSTHKRRIMQKLQVESLASLVRYALLNKLIDAS